MVPARSHSSPQPELGEGMCCAVLSDDHVNCSCSTGLQGSSRSCNSLHLRLQLWLWPAGARMSSTWCSRGHPHCTSLAWTPAHGHPSWLDPSCLDHTWHEQADSDLRALPGCCLPIKHVMKHILKIHHDPNALTALLWKNSAFYTLFSNFSFLLSHQYLICLTGRKQIHVHVFTANKQPVVQAEQAEDTIRPICFPFLLVKIPEVGLLIYLTLKSVSNVMFWTTK